MLDPTRYQLLTFDCYGTLIDWESGILRALHSLLAAHDTPSPGDRELLALYAELEPAAQAGDYRSYRDVLADVTRGYAEALAIKLDPGQEHTLADSIADWPVYKDTSKALARLAAHYDLAILSNIDRDIFEGTRPKLLAGQPFEFAAVITAEDTRSYKPAIGHFWHAIDSLGIPGARILHVAQSLYHDITPAQSMGISTVWVNRHTGRDGHGVTPFTEAEHDVEPDLEVPDLRTLADLLVGV